MGRDMKRRTAFFDAAGRRVELYEMTKGQKLALAATNQRKMQEVIQRLWVILESLFVKHSDWDKFDDAVVMGKIEYEDAETFASSVLTYKWPEPQDEPESDQPGEESDDDY